MALALTTSLAGAAVLTWDNVSTDGLWNTTSNNWGGSFWNNATPDSPLFGATGAGTVTLGEAITVGDITFSAAGYTIAGAPDLTIASPTTITADSDATISAQMIGSGGLTKAGGAILTLATNNTYTGRPSSAPARWPWARENTSRSFRTRRRSWSTPGQRFRPSIPTP